MIAITMLRIDERGRITLPDYFLKANDIKKGSNISVYPVYNREDSIRLEFEFKEIK
tara:strand:- start:387 stop:554 length:168 start_codon:yes stop_codon:yes gene_type:complete